MAAPNAMRLDYICLQPTREGQASFAHVTAIVDGLRRLGWDVRLVQPAHPRPGRLDAVRRVRALASAQLRYWIGCRLRPARYVYVRTHFAAWPTSMLAKAAGAIVIQELNGPFEDALDAWPRLRPARGLVVRAMAAQLRSADAVVVVTEGLVGYARSRTGRRSGFHVIGNGADVELFTPRPPDHATGTTPYVVFVGALAPWQGIGTVVGAMGSPRWPSGVDVLIAGDGQERGRVQAAERSNPHLHWLGSVPYAETPGLVAASVAALVPMADVARSRSGLSPLKLFEAMACGVPVIASDLPGLGDVVRAHECGVVVPPDDPDALAAAVAALASGPAAAHAMGERGRAAAVEHFSWDLRARQTERVLLGMTARRSPATV